MKSQAHSTFGGMRGSNFNLVIGPRVHISVPLLEQDPRTIGQSGPEIRLMRISVYPKSYGENYNMKTMIKLILSFNNLEKDLP